MRCTCAAAAALLFALTGSSSVGAEEVETTGQFLLSIPARTLGPVIEHCAENAPELKNDLLNERPAFIEKLTEAGRPLLEKLKSDPEFNAPVQASMREDMDKINSYGLSIFKQQDAGVVCRRALEKMQNATVDELRKGVEDTYQKYREAGQARKSE